MLSGHCQGDLTCGGVGLGQSGKTSWRWRDENSTHSLKMSSTELFVQSHMGMKLGLDACMCIALSSQLALIEYLCVLGSGLERHTYFV